MINTIISSADPLIARINAILNEPINRATTSDAVIASNRALLTVFRTKISVIRTLIAARVKSLDPTFDAQAALNKLLDALSEKIKQKIASRSSTTARPTTARPTTTSTTVAPTPANTEAPTEAPETIDFGGIAA